MNGSPTRLKTYIITLPEAVRRRRFMEAQLLNFPFMDAEFVNGVKGVEMSSEELERAVDRDSCRRTIGRSLTPSEIGSTLSHLRVMQRIDHENVPLALVLEDDALISGRIGGVIAGVLRFLQGDRPGIVLLTPCKYLRSRGSRIHPDFSVQPYFRGFYASGYVINRMAAKAISSALMPLRAHLDWWHITREVSGIAINALVPYLVGISISENTVSYIDRGDRTAQAGQEPDTSPSLISRLREFVGRARRGVVERVRGIRGQRLIF